MTSTITPPRAPTPGAFLDASSGGMVEPGTGLRGFGGLTDGLALGFMAGAMNAHLPGSLPQSATIRFHRPLTGAFRLETELGGTGHPLITATARAFTDQGICADATAVFATEHTGGHRVAAPPAPSVPGPERCERHVVAPEAAPVTAHLDIRPVASAPARPGGAPERTAWIRLTEDDTPPDFFRLMVLMDVPAAFCAPAPHPTLQFTAYPGLGLSRAASPWVLVRATVHRADEDGRTDERVDAWGPDGLHLGSARRLRTVRGG
ncbi:hypothetical protein [Actinocorallia libanotica]|uniref:Acyl-CoA thioesterase-like C-terminal domain-containing protein n=1 Tax=Actinocorallia libanotica TaxID=46162 RepID=A0ABN1RV15_9ACTN